MGNREPYQFRLPPVIYVGEGASNVVGQEATHLGAEKVLVVTDEKLVQMGHLDPIEKGLRSSGIEFEVYEGVTTEPTVRHVEEGLRLLKESGCNAIVTLGGGSPIDAGKGIAAMANNPGAIRDYMGMGKLPAPGVPLIAVPTTAGTGSEVTKFTVITDTETNVKMLIGSNYVIPEVALVDPLLTLTMPQDVTAATGIDALTHAIEAYVSKRAQPISDVLALSAIKLIASNLRQSWWDNENLQARSHVMLGAHQAGMAFSNASVALVHGMSRPIGAYFHVSHGLSNASLLSAVIAFSLPSAPERYGDIAAAMGEDIGGRSTMEAARASVDAVTSLCEDIKIPKLRDLGVEETKLKAHGAQMAEDALASGSPDNNPQKASKEEIIELYWEAF